MIMFVSSRTLPGIRFDRFAGLLNGTRHFVEVGGIDAAGEPQKLAARGSRGLVHSARKV